MDWLVRPLFLKNILKNTGAMEKYMEQECPDDITYTAVKPPILGGPEVTGQSFTHTVRQFFNTLHAAIGFTIHIQNRF